MTRDVAKSPKCMFVLPSLDVSGRCSRVRGMIRSPNGQLRTIMRSGTNAPVRQAAEIQLFTSREPSGHLQQGRSKIMKFPEESSPRS